MGIFACMCIWVMVPELLKLESQTVVRGHVGAGN